MEEEIPRQRRVYSAPLAPVCENLPCPLHFHYILSKV